MNNKLTFITSAAVLAMSAGAANAATYDVYGLWDSITEISATSGGPANSLTGANLTISGTVTTDTNTAGYNITGGTLTISGTLNIPYSPAPGQVVTLWQTWNGTGTATNDGVLFNQGSLCLGFFAGDCSQASTDFTINPAYFDGTGTFAGGFATTNGLTLTGGAGGASFSVAQPGVLTGPGNLYTAGTGTMNVAGTYGALFLGGELTFTEAAPEVPVPAAAWLFGSALLGLTGIGRSRKARS